MGTVCCGTKPPEKFIGKWTNHANESLIIYPNGCIFYLKQMGRCRVRYKNCPAQYEEDSVHYCCCHCCELHGTFQYGENGIPQLIVNGTVMTKEPGSNSFETYR